MARLEVTFVGLTDGSHPRTIAAVASWLPNETRSATWESLTLRAASDRDGVTGGVNTRDRERAARSGFAACVGSGFAGDRGRWAHRRGVYAAPSFISILAQS
jgi:hypothetical protein